MIARTAQKGLRTAVLGGWAVILAALVFGSASSGAVALAEAGRPPAAGATDGAGSFSATVSIKAPAGGATYRPGVSVALLGGAGAPGHALTGTALHWVVLRHSGAVVEQVAEATGTDAAFVPAPGSASTDTYEVRLTATDADGDSATASVTMRAATAPGSDDPLQDVGTALGSSAPGSGISGSVQFSGPVLRVKDLGTNTDATVRGTVHGLPAGARVELAISRTGYSTGCRWWSVRAGRFVAGRCDAPRFIVATLHRTAIGRARWEVRVGTPLPASNMALVLRIRDRHGAFIPFTRR